MAPLHSAMLAVLTLWTATSPVLARTAETRTTTVTRWVGPEGSRPITYEEWKAKSKLSGPLRIRQIPTATISQTAPDSVSILIAVNSDLYPDIHGSVDQYVIDLQNDGYSVEIYATSGGTPEDFRAFLQTKYAEGLDGCVLIGDLPVPWYQCMDDFENDGILDGYEEFPIDLYYQDLNGSWSDELQNVGNNLVPGSDGILDTHTGDVQPEIWLGRLTASPLDQTAMPESFLLQLYFSRNHHYRVGDLTRPDTALVYTDDDWAGSAQTLSENVGLAFPDPVSIADVETTTAADYRVRLDVPFHSILVSVHSWSGGHSFKYNGGSQWQYMYVSELPGIDPEAFFYNLFACSNARYVDPDYMGGWYTFCQSYGLGAVGSTKTGSMLGFEHFYGPLGEGKNVGEAMRDWWIAFAPGGYTPDEYSWFYGMTLLGDPTFTVRGLVGPFRPLDHTADDSQFGNGDGILDPGETIDLTVPIRNVCDSTLTDVRGTLRSQSPYATVLDSVASYGTLTPQQSAAGDAYQFQIAFSLPGGSELPFTLHLESSGGSPARMMDLPITLKVERYDYLDHNLGNVVLTVTKQGSLGYLDPMSTGSGFLGPGSSRSMLYHGSFVLGTSPTFVADDFGNSADWVETTTPDGRLRVTLDGDSVQTSWAMFCDSGMTSSRGLTVVQTGEARKGDQKGDFVLLRYLVRNTGSSPVTGAYIGLFADLDIFSDVGYATNLAGTDPSRELAYVKWSSYNPYAGVCLLEGTSANLSVVENDTYFPGKVATDSTMFRFLTGDLSFPSGALQKDYSAIISCGPYDLDPGDSQAVAFAVIYGQNLADLLENADSARSVAAVGVAAPPPNPRPTLPTLSMYQNTPNPFSAATQISYDISSAVPHHSLRVYNVLGQCVRTLADGAAEAGRHVVAWDGCSDQGKRLVSGIYLYRLEAGGQTLTNKLVLVRDR
jgi:hypothetical protein